MAIVLDAFASYIQNMLTEMAKEEVHMLIGVPTEINKMDIKLRDIKKFLADADRRNITDESVQAWVKEYRGAMYDATDILDLCQLKAMEKRGPSRDMGCFNPLLFCMRNPLHAHDIGMRLKSLNGKLDDLGKRSTTFNFINLTSYEDHGRRIESSHLASRETTGEFDKLGLVGENIEEDTRNLVELLTRKNVKTHERNKIKVFAIVGVGGIGKTTLAQNIFNSETIQQEFNKKIWLSVNKDFNDLDLLERAITEVGGELPLARNTKFALVRNLKQALGGFKTLLVMDDVWDYQAWERVLKSPLTNTLGQGSCVLVTTRHDTVARGMMAEEPYHHVHKLESEDAWSLLKKQVVQNENGESQVDMLKDIGFKVIEKCDGLPLAVKVMGGLLRQKRTRRSDWENVINNSIWSISQMPEELNYAIYLSYQDLHPSLKSCFLHFSLLPRSALFMVDEIVGMWIGEGFIYGGQCDFEELGNEYYNELILRNLIEPDTRYVDQVVCNMHDVVRSFAQYVARDEALAGHKSKTDIMNKLNSQKIIHLSLETKDSESSDLEWISLQTHDSLRTLISVGPIKIKPDDSLVTFLSLRILHITRGANVDALAKSLVQLKHLRYLSIENTNLSILPANIGKMKFLQYISLYGCKTFEKLPGSIRKLQNLRFLCLTNTSINVPIGFHDLTDLRKLYGFPAHMDGDRCSLGELGSLSKLTALHIDCLENISSSSFANKAKLFEKVHLRYLQLSCSNKRGDDDPWREDDENMSNQRHQQIKEVFDELCPPSCIENLLIDGYFGRQLPSWMTLTTAPPFGSLRLVMMEDLPFCTELPDGLCQLPCLELLKIKNAPAIKRVGPEVSQRHHHNEQPSASLNFGSAVQVLVVQCFSLERICNLPKTQELRIIMCPVLKVVEGMPELQRLVLEDYKMKKLPGYLQDLHPKCFHVYCDISLLTSMATWKSGPEWFKFSHIKQVKAYAVDDDNNIKRKCYVSYTRDPFSFKTNISRSSIAQAREERFQRFCITYCQKCPTEEEWVIGHASSDKCQPLCERFRCNAYRYLVWWLRRECLHCCEACNIADSSHRWTDDATVFPAAHLTEVTAQQFARPGPGHFRPLI